MTPWFIRYDKTPLHIHDSYLNCAAFLVCGGPSINTQPLNLLRQPGLLVCSVNNAATKVRGQLWVGVDNAKNFSDQVWLDPGVWKFAPARRFDDEIRSRNDEGEFVFTGRKVKDMPCVAGIELVSEFRASTYLKEPGFCWGCGGDIYDSQDNAGSRSVMLVALKVLYILGVRTVFLLGCDFRMRFGGQNYAFEQDRSRSSVRGNNRTYRVLNERFRALVPFFEAAGFRIFNCTPDSGLHAFPKLDYEDAIGMALSDFPRSVDTRGMYDT